MHDAAAHWDEVYGKKRPDEVSWFRPHLERSLAFVERAQLGAGAGILDVGGGASTLVDDLLERGFTNVTVLDIAAAGLEVAQRRLGERAARVRWLVGDVTRVELPEQGIDFWHDRAVFHFLKDPEDRRRYVEAVRRAVRPGGHVIVATFGPNGPERCSGLEVQRYSAEGIHGEFGAGFTRVDSAEEAHTTPGGKVQAFVYCFCRRA